MLRPLFFFRTELVVAGPAGRNALPTDAIAIILQNDSAGKRLGPFCEELEYGEGGILNVGLDELVDAEAGIVGVQDIAEPILSDFAAKEKGKHRVMIIHDEGDLLCRGDGKVPPTAAKMSDLHDKLQHVMYVTATAHPVLLQEDVVPYMWSFQVELTSGRLSIQKKLSSNYYGLHNVRIDCEKIDRGAAPPKLHGEMGFPGWSSSTDHETHCFGKSGSHCFGQLNRAKHVFKSMLEEPNRVLPGWRHAAVFIKIARQQQLAPCTLRP